MKLLVSWWLDLQETAPSTGSAQRWQGEMSVTSGDAFSIYLGMHSPSVWGCMLLLSGDAFSIYSGIQYYSYSFSVFLIFSLSFLPLLFLPCEVIKSLSPFHSLLSYSSLHSFFHSFFHLFSMQTQLEEGRNSVKWKRSLFLP